MGGDAAHMIMLKRTVTAQQIRCMYFTRRVVVGGVKEWKPA